MMVSKSNDVAVAVAAAVDRPSPPVPSASAAAPGAPAVAPAPAQVEQAVRSISKAIQPISRNLHFSIDEATGHTVVRVVDTETGNLIRQIPTQEALDIARVLDRMQGLLLNDKA